MKKIILLMSVLTLAFVMNSCGGSRDFDSNTELWGVVTNAVTGEPIGNVTVTLSPGGGNAVTGSDGLFQFTDLAPQQFTVTAQRSGYQTNRRTVTAVVAQVTEVNITLTPNP